MTAPLSPDEGVRAALEADKRYPSVFYSPDREERISVAHYTGADGPEPHVTVSTLLENRPGGRWLVVQFAPEEAEQMALHLLQKTASVRAALSTPVPEEGLPRGSASAAEGDVPSCVRTALDAAQVKMGVDSDIWFLDSDLTYPTQSAASTVLQSLRAMAWPTTMAGRKVAPFEVFLILKERLNSDRLGREFLPAAAREIAALSAEPGAGAASALPSPLPSQGELARLQKRFDTLKDAYDRLRNRPIQLTGSGGRQALPSQGEPVALKPIGYASPDDFAKPIRVSGERSVYLMGKPSEVWSWPIYRPEDVAEALAAERARADSLKRDLEATREALSEVEGARATLEAATIQAEARADRAEEDVLDRLFEAWNAAGFDVAASLLASEGAIMPKARAALRARNILKETPDEAR